MIKLIPIIAVGILLAGCNPATLSEYCKLAKGIHWSRLDTTQTQREVIAHNATYISQNCPEAKVGVAAANREAQKSRRKK